MVEAAGTNDGCNERLGGGGPERWRQGLGEPAAVGGGEGDGGQDGGLKYRWRAPGSFGGVHQSTTQARARAVGAVVRSAGNFT